MRLFLFLLIVFLAAPVSAQSQDRVADPADVGSIEGLMKAYYEVVSGPAGTPRRRG